MLLQTVPDSMTPFQVTILGAGSAMPTTQHHPPSQLVNMNGMMFMIDCGEGTQVLMRRADIRIGKLHSIFISHLHGDHIFGLPGLFSTLSLLGRTGDVTLYAHREIEALLEPFLAYMCSHLTFQINLVPLNPIGTAVLFENRSVRISSFPLNHRVDTNGFLFEEKRRPNHIRKEMIEAYDIPFRAIRSIKQGVDYTTGGGEVIPNERLTYPAHPPRRYAYCSDTAYDPAIVPYIRGVDLLYHEATFAESEKERAKETFHSTARQAALIAREAGVGKLIIGHFSSRYRTFEPLLQEALEIFPHTELAVEGSTIAL